MTAVVDLKPFAEASIERWCQTIQSQRPKIFNDLQIIIFSSIKLGKCLIRLFARLCVQQFFWWERFRWRLSRLDPSSKSGLLIYLLLAFANSVTASSRLSLCYYNEKTYRITMTSHQTFTCASISAKANKYLT